MPSVQYKDKKFSVIDKTLNLNNRQIESINDIEGLDDLSDLQNLYLRNNKISTIEGLDKLKNLTQLDLGFNSINEITGLDTLPQLEYLDLHANKISVIVGLDNLTSLKILYLSSNYITEIDGLKCLSSLEKLILLENGISEIKGLKSLVNLQELCLEHNRIDKIKGLDNLKNLRILNLMENVITKIENLSHLKLIKQLSLTRNDITAIEPVFELLSLDLISLGDNPIVNKGHKFLAELDIDFPSLRYLYSLPLYKTLNFDDIPKEIKRIREELEKKNDTEFINIGTHMENSDLKDKQNFVFLTTRVIPEKLVKKNTSKTELILHLIQIHSLKGIKPASEDNIGHFLYFIKHFWDDDLIDRDKVLVYSEREVRVKMKIEELVSLSLRLNSNNPLDLKPDIIIFPENSIPYISIDYLKEMSQKYNVIFIGGLEHQKDKNYSYINRVFIIDKGIIRFQIKQTPVRISKIDMIENIECVKNPQIQIFETSIGRLSVFICKDFLRLNEIIPIWASINQIDYIVVPSLTNKIIPFQAKILSILDSPNCKNIKLLYVSMGEYGGSELFSLKTKQSIEKRFRLNKRDNIGETIVSRRISQEPDSFNH